MKRLEIFKAFLKLGLTSFGGPVAHLGYFRHEFVDRRKWLSEHAYADLVALCQFLPGPASSQVGIAIGLSRAGLGGALAAWLGFTLPSAIVLVLFAFGLSSFAGAEQMGWVHGLKIAAVAVVAQAVVSMAKTLTPDPARMTIAGISAAILLAVPAAWCQVGIMIAAGATGFLFLKNDKSPPHVEIPVPVTRLWGAISLGVFFMLLAGLPVLSHVSGNHTLNLLDSFYRAGSLVFGGGHVVLPLLQSGVVTPGWITNDQFLAGYGAAQAIPGPLFTFAAYLGAVMEPQPNGWAGAALCVFAIFLPSFLLIAGAMPFWESVRKYQGAQSCMRGINAAVVGILLAALYTPVGTSGITSAADFALAAAAFFLLTSGKAPSWLIVALCAIGGIFLPTSQ